MLHTVYLASMCFLNGLPLPYDLYWTFTSTLVLNVGRSVAEQEAPCLVAGADQPCRRPQDMRRKNILATSIVASHLTSSLRLNPCAEADYGYQVFVSVVDGPSPPTWYPRALLDIDALSG